MAGDLSLIPVKRSNEQQSRCVAIPPDAFELSAMYLPPRGKQPRSCRHTGAAAVTATTALRDASVDASLQFRRFEPPPAPHDPTSTRPLLGARTFSSGHYHTHGGDSGDIDSPLVAELLWPSGIVRDAWLAPGPAVASGSSGCVHYRFAGSWVHGSAWVHPGRVRDDLEQATLAAYSEIFAVLASHGSPHLLRLWNYVPGINVESRGIERYRAFNAGRQRAFIDARRSAFDGAPAVCALGTLEGGPLRVFFLAGPNVPVTIENPRQVSAYHYPQEYGPRSPTFSRAALVDAGGDGYVLFISGTASIVGHATVHAGDVRQQTEETLANIEVVLVAARQRAGMSLDAGDLHLTVYVRHRGDLPVIRRVLENRLGIHSPAVRSAIYLLADVCRADLLVEIEAHGTLTSGVGS